jgi:Domain of unknown function (DUF4270)
MKRLNQKLDTSALKTTSQKNISIFIQKFWVKILPLSLFLLPFMWACNDPAGEIGRDLIGQEIQTDYLDTTVALSTILLDSNITNNGSFFLVGGYDDPVFGRVNANAFFEMDTLDAPIPSTIEAAKVTYDSVIFRMAYAYHYGDTLRPMTLSLHPLTKSFDDTKFYFNKDNIDFDPTPIFSRQVTPRPVRYRSAKNDTIRYDTLRVKLDLNNAFVRRLLNYTRGAKDFSKEVPGFVLRSNNTGGAVLGFNPNTTRFAVYFRFRAPKDPNNRLSPDSTYQGLYRIFSEISGIYTNQFNEIVAQRRGALAGLSATGVPASATNNEVYVQPALGVATKVVLPSFKELRARLGGGAINKAELIFETKNNTQLDLPVGFSMVESTPQNQLVRIDTKSGDQVFSNLVNVPFDITLDQNNSTVTIPNDAKQVKFNLTSYVQNKMVLSNLITTAPNNNVIITGPITSIGAAFNAPAQSYVISSVVNRAVLNAQTAKLRIYYTRTKR